MVSDLRVMKIDLHSKHELFYFKPKSTNDLLNALYNYAQTLVVIL